jgi:hypothetical protein
VPDFRTFRSRLRTWHIAVVAGVWIAAVAYGQRVLLNYDFAAAPAANAPAQWPAQSSLPRTSGLPTIVMVAHPHCPCTRATIEELAIIMARVHDHATADVVFVHPHGFSETWEKTDLWQSAARIPGVSVYSDLDAVEATRFGAQASGQTFLFAPDGKLLFSGGIVPFRGHAGDNPGRTAIVSLVSTGTAKVHQTSVYGCSLHDPERAAAMDRR